MKKILQDESGLTLIEIMIAAGIVATALAIVFGSLVSVSMIGRSNRERTMAASAVGSMMDQISRQDLADLASTGGGMFDLTDFTLPGITQNVVMEALIGDETVLLPTEQALTAPTQIKLTFVWMDERNHTNQLISSVMIGE